MESTGEQTNRPNRFSWERIGDIPKGREHLGTSMPVLVYRLMQYAMMDVLRTEFGEEKANLYFQKAGFLAGAEFAKNALDLKADFGTFVESLRDTLLKLKIGILRMENYDPDTGEIMLTIGEDLDCSGIPVSNEMVCWYDEGFLTGILETYTGKKYTVKEIDCWASGDRVCRFRGTVAP